MKRQSFHGPPISVDHPIDQGPIVSSDRGRCIRPRDLCDRWSNLEEKSICYLYHLQRPYLQGNLCSKSSVHELRLKSIFQHRLIYSILFIKSIMVPAADRSMTRVIDYMKFVSQEKRNVDLCDIFFRFTLEAFVLMTLVRD